MSNTKSSSKRRNVNKEVFTVGPALTGFARVVKAGQAYDGKGIEYNLQLEFDPDTAEGKEAIKLITDAHNANVEFERGQHPEAKDVLDYGVPLKTTNLEEVNTKGNKINPDVFTTGRIQLKAKSKFEPGLVGSLRDGDGGNSNLRGIMTHEIPVGSTVKVMLALISYFQPEDKKKQAKAVAGSSVKLQSVKILKQADRKDFEDDTSAEVLRFNNTTNNSTQPSFDNTFDESTGIE